MSDTTFENAKVGDRVYSCKSVGDKTNAEIKQIDKKAEYGILVDIDTENGVDYIDKSTFRRLLFSNRGQVLFLENPICSIPMLPKETTIEENLKK